MSNKQEVCFFHLAQNSSAHGMAASFVKQTEDLKVGYQQGDLFAQALL